MATVQFIGYQIQTAAEGDTTRKNYPGLANQRSDMEHRCKIMADAIIAAQKSPWINAMALKLFVAPEFFFRGGKDGAYDLTLISEINGIMDRYLSNSAFRKWIFILGTAIGSFPSQKANEMEIFNIALVRKGGIKVARKLNSDESLSSGEKDSLLIYKEYVSHIDYLGKNFGNSPMFHGDPVQAGKANLFGKQLKLMATAGSRSTGCVLGVGNPNIHGEKRSWSPSLKSQLKTEIDYRKGKLSKSQRDKYMATLDYEISEQSSTGLGGGSIFEMDGLRFVTEICLDHAQRRAEKANPQNIDLHIVTSCGMQPEYSVTKKGGYFFLVDGIADDSQCVALIQKKVTGGYDFKDDFKTIDMANHSNWHNYMGNGKNMFQKGKGTVYISKKQNI